MLGRTGQPAYHGCEGAARGITLNEVATSTVGRRVMARSTSVHLEVHEAPSLGTPSDDGSAAGLSAASNERRIERDKALCGTLMRLRGRVLEGKITRGQLRAHAVQFSGHTRIVMEDVLDLARVLADDAVPATLVHAGEFELLLACLQSHFDTYAGPPPPPLAPESGGALGGSPAAPQSAPPGLPMPGTPLGSRTAGARGLRVVVVSDDGLSVGGGVAPSSAGQPTGAP